ncbi:MAG: 3-phosphoshikimate 1-carboxyvinyltransferase [Deltaproteobacteria bacterium]|nr:3-phosphoshikimate 1-carboxyvinyltransferase [Deltaproteobacteria bacterium]
MKLAVEKSKLHGSVPIPGSKSHTIRAVAISALADGESTIREPLISGDTLSAVACYRALGAEVDDSDSRAWRVKGTGGAIIPPEKVIDVGNSGTTLRCAVSSAALSSRSSAIRFTGDSQIQQRPLAPLLQSLNQLGATAISERDNGRAPVSIRGRLKGGKTSIACLTSQYLSSLLLATPLAENDTEIEVTLLNEPDYVQITLDWLDKQEIAYLNQGLRFFRVAGGQRYRAFDLPIPADFSSATFFLCAGALLDADITLTGLDFSDSQPDKAVAGYLKEMGADIAVEGSSVRVKKSSLKGIEIDMNRTPDALPAMAVTAAFAEGTTRLVNVPQARSKETDRIACMAIELRKMGVDTEELPEGLVVHHCAELKSAVLDGYGDHRIVMALSLAAMAMEGTTLIDTAEAIDVTFPEFVPLMKSLGARMNLITS